MLSYPIMQPFDAIAPQRRRWTLYLWPAWGLLSSTIALYVHALCSCLLVSIVIGYRKVLTEGERCRISTWEEGTIPNHPAGYIWIIEWINEQEEVYLSHSGACRGEIKKPGDQRIVNNKNHIAVMGMYTVVYHPRVWLYTKAYILALCYNACIRGN